MDPPDHSNLFFELLPIGAYRSSEAGQLLRANDALVRMLGFESEASMIAAMTNLATELYVEPQRRQQFKEQMAREGKVVNFVSELYRHQTRERIWVRDNSHAVHDEHGALLYFEGTIEDITASRAADKALRDSEAQLRMVTAQVPGMVFLMQLNLDGTRQYTYVSDGVRALFGVTPAQVLADSGLLRSFRHPQDSALVEEQMREAPALPESVATQFRIVLRDGTVKWLEVTASTVSHDAQGCLRCGLMIDITERKRTEALVRETEERWKLALEGAGDGVWDWYVQTGVEFFSKRCKEMYGYAEDDMPDQADVFDALTHPDDAQQMARDRQAHFDGLTPTYVNEHRIRCKDGHWKWVLTRGMVVSRDAQGQPLRMIGTHTDITERKKSEAMIWQQANFDTLTGLPNRRMLRERLEQELRKCKREGTQLAVLFVDLDHFKEVNDSLGHDNGDLLLIEAATRIRGCLRESDTVARMGGDEFTVLLPDLADSAGLEYVAQKLLTTLSGAFQLGDEQVFVSASIGISHCPQDGTQVEQLFKNADQALYVAKGAGRNRYSYFKPAMQEAAQVRARLAADLRLGLQAGQFEVHYQPIVSLCTGAVYKAEALLRWRHPARGMVSPAVFIPIAEGSGSILEIGEWVYRQAAAQVRRWRAELAPNFQISVNKSPVQFQQPAKVHTSWIEHLSDLGLPGQSIVIEITEGLLLETDERVTNQLLDFHDAGIQVALDDFGTGYSSLSYLQRFDIDFLKIDQSFVRHLIPDSTDLALCKAIIVMAHELGMQVIAEGVETEVQRDLLTAAGCDFGQGYLFARPMPASELEAWVRARPAPASGALP
ncbi:EAL domain-containing protein [Rhodoferax sp.]|uniref:sensor domain-containing protein n=1 Tax=Rhodoferax sp. TaxID=50421 RepID=UPI00275B856B|nr:EAL domain-containing protein [Rhodoferax sp.]